MGVHYLASFDIGLLLWVLQERDHSPMPSQVGMILDLSNHECLYSDDIPDTLAYRHVYLVSE